MSTTSSHQTRLLGFLKKEVGGFGMSNEDIKRFSNDLKTLGILDMSKSNTQQWLMEDDTGRASLITLGTWSQLGLLGKIAEIKTITTGK